MIDPGHFISLVRNTTDLRPEELKSVRDLEKQFPYSQVLHLLRARGARDLKENDAEACLHQAAVYSTDRAVLKKVVTAPRQPRTASPAKAEPAPVTITATPPAEKPAAIPAEEKARPKKAEPIELKAVPQGTPPSELEGDALREDLKMELNRLQHLMHAFEASYEQLKHNDPAPPAEPVNRKGAKKSATPAEGSADAPLIEEIKTSKRKPKIVSPKVAEQSEIIDQFIKVVPTLPRTKPAETSADLSESSVNYGDHIISETLVDILLKQGKKAKAIEMLKKLIWKFPQKKAYFAAQIEALKG